MLQLTQCVNAHEYSILTICSQVGTRSFHLAPTSISSGTKRHMMPYMSDPAGTMCCERLERHHHEHTEIRVTRWQSRLYKLYLPLSSVLSVRRTGTGLSLTDPLFFNPKGHRPEARRTKERFFSCHGGVSMAVERNSCKSVDMEDTVSSEGLECGRFGAKCSLCSLFLHRCSTIA